MLLVVLFLSPAALLADEGDSLATKSWRTPVALPGQSAYTGEGLSIGLAGGVFNPIEECDCMGSWQGQLEYFYTETVSGSFDVRFFGGDLDSDKMVIHQRYRISVKLHNAYDDYAIFAGGFLGLENTSISAFRSQVVNQQEAKRSKNHYWWQLAEDDEEEKADSSKAETNCGKLFAMDGFSLGLGIGNGYNVSRLFALTGLLQVEYNFSKDVLLSVVPGLAFNLREVWPWAKKSLRSTWISFEIGGQRYVHGGVGGWSNTFLLGIELGA